MGRGSAGVLGLSFFGGNWAVFGEKSASAFEGGATEKHRGTEIHGEKTPI